MKKILLGTTALIGAVTLFAGAASAENPKVTVGGFADFQAGWVSGDDLTDTPGVAGDNQRDYGFRNDTEVTVHVDGKTDQGLGYGAVIDLEADVGNPANNSGFGGVSSDADNQGFNASRTYVYLDGGWGRFELGSAEGADYTMKVDAANIARATGGIDGDWHYFANFTATAATPYVFDPRLPASHGSLLVAGDESTINDNKITYYSPRFSGFQVGVSYAPDLTDRGQVVTRTDEDGASAGDIISAGINYEGQFNEVTLAAAVTGQWGDGDTDTAAAGTGAEDIRAWNAGLQLGFAGFSVAGSYGDWDDSLSTGVAGTADESNYWTLGAAYDFGPFGVSATYFDSETDLFGAGAGTDEFNNLSIGADYKLAEGLTPYVEVSFYDMDAPGAAADNDGTVVLVGTELAF